MSAKVWKTASKEWPGLQLFGAEMLSWEEWICQAGKGWMMMLLLLLQTLVFSFSFLNSSAQAVGIVHILWSQCDTPSLAQGAELWFGSRG